MVIQVLLRNSKLVISIAVVFGAFMYRNELKSYYETFVHEEDEEIPGVFTSTKLAEFDGVKQNLLYLAVLGTVFDVTEGKIHYEKGAAYHYFIGKDGSRSLVTGNFKDESNEKDHTLDLSCYDILTLVHWRSTFRKKYIEVGILTGRYYEKNGEKTAYMKEFYEKMKQCEVAKENSRKEDQKYPPCNVAWTAEGGTKVWCTTSSGGVKRSWVGVPRQLYTPGVDNPHCVCLNGDNQDPTGLLKKYKNCPKSSTECIIKA